MTHIALQQQIDCIKLQIMGKRDLIQRMQKKQSAIQVGLQAMRIIELEAVLRTLLWLQEHRHAVVSVMKAEGHRYEPSDPRTDERAEAMPDG
jgi:hypothetical protein